MRLVELEARWALADVAAWGVDTDLAALTDSGIQRAFVYVCKGKEGDGRLQPWAAFGAGSQPHFLAWKRLKGPNVSPQESGLWVSVVAKVLCCPDVARSSPSPPNLPALAPLAFSGSSQVAGTSQPPGSQPEHLDKGQVGLPRN